MTDLVNLFNVGFPKISGRKIREEDFLQNKTKRRTGNKNNDDRFNSIYCYGLRS